MRATITVKMDNAAFNDPGELARILRALAGQVDCGGHEKGTITAQDFNGNTVATLTIRGKR